MFINEKTGVPASAGEIRLAHPEISFPPDITIEHIEELGYAELEYDPSPELSEGEQLQPGDIREEDGRYIRGWEVVPAPVPTADTIATRRWQAETGGTTVAGMPLDTGRDSQALIAGAAVSAMLDPEYSVRWKTTGGFVELSAEQIIGVARAVRAHVQACFDREAELLEALEAGTFTAEMLETGWP